MTEDQPPAGGAPAAGYAWGYNDPGGLGIGSVARAMAPVPVEFPGGTPWIYRAAPISLWR